MCCYSLVGISSQSAAACTYCSVKMTSSSNSLICNLHIVTLKWVFLTPKLSCSFVCYPLCDNSTKGDKVMCTNQTGDSVLCTCTPQRAVLRFVLSNNIAVPCILRGEYSNICIYAPNSIPAPLLLQILSTPLLPCSYMQCKTMHIPGSFYISIHNIHTQRWSCF